MKEKFRPLAGLKPKEKLKNPYPFDTISSTLAYSLLKRI
ncbi:hypothetical protein FTV88_3365 [Heliorestis convoluta]|uniref:Uncharacterized protein n=1 Tax=Heliorestis convoluta TaxID=356322 RepID=A0A5Q2NAZ7_9FIRM|nr:hypothetical protein FTV88_3365 [Heliorestis convoluta]